MLKTKADALALAFAGALLGLLAFASFEAFYLQCAAVRENTLRLHVIAASDGEADQRNKLLVRDAVLSEYGPALSAGGSIGSAVAVTEKLTDAIALTAEKTLRAAGCEDGATASVVSMYFDTITYENGETLPAGEYQALRIVIGTGAGRNWWCVMYPPLCIPAAVKEPSADEERILALNETPRVTAKFAVVELYEKARRTLFSR